MNRKAFSAKIYKVGIPCVDVPKTVSDNLDKKGFILVSGTVNRYPIMVTLVPVKNALHRLYINGEMRNAANVGVGDRVNIVLAFDAKPRIVQMPTELIKAFRQNKIAKSLFEKLSPSHRKEILICLNRIKKPETLKRNVAKVIKLLIENKL